MKPPWTAVDAPRLNGLLLFLCAMALASPLVEAVPGNSTTLFWLSRAIGVAVAAAAVVWPRIQGPALAGTALFLVVLPCWFQMHYRSWTGPETYCHDSVLQFEEAIRMVRRGENPYARDFADTALPKWKDWSGNPAVHHFVYPPLLLVLSTPVEAACRAVLWRNPPAAQAAGERFFDQRLVLLAFFGGLLWLLWKRLRDHPNRTGLIALAALNPWFGPFVVEGRNDVVMIFWVAAAWAAYESKRDRWGDVLLGIAIASKTLLLPIVPFVAMARRREWLMAVGLMLAPLALTAAPFLAADPPSFLEDVFGAPAGLGSHPFEIRGWGGLGFANLVLFLGWVDSPAARFPFGLFQAMAYAPCTIFGLRRLQRAPSMADAFLIGAGALFAVLYFGRFVHDNYFGALLSVAVISRSGRETPPDANSTPFPG